jgi:uncharacterized protein
LTPFGLAWEQELFLLSPLPLVLLTNAAEAGARGRPALRAATDLLLVLLPALVVVVGVGEGLAALATHLPGNAVAGGFGVALAGLVAGLAGAGPVVRRLAAAIPIDPANRVHRLAVALTSGLVVLQLVTQLTSDVLAQAAGGSSLTRADLVAQEIPFLLAAVLGVGAGTRRRPPAVAERLGWVRPRVWQLLLALAAAGLFYALAVGVDWLASWLTPGLANRVNAANGRIFGALGDPLGIATIAITAGICEEAFFRGALQVRLGVLWTAVVFASVHTQYGLSLDTLAVLVLAIGLGLLRRLTNTTTSTVCHVAYNALVGTGIGGLGLGWALGAEATLLGLAVAAAPAARHFLTSGLGERRPMG